jgi:hypothetical protein
VSFILVQEPQPFLAEGIAYVSEQPIDTGYNVRSKTPGQFLGMLVVVTVGTESLRIGVNPIEPSHVRRGDRRPKTQ